MPIEWTARFERDMKKLPKDIQRRVDRLLLLLDTSRDHPSLHLKRIHRLPNHWVMRVTEDWRIVLTIVGDTFTLAAIGKHDILDTFKNN